jgi:Ca2+-transporting ATPase
VDEASLTGESNPMTKINTSLSAEHLSVIDQKNMVFKGTHVLSGNGIVVAVATGLKTEIGKIAQKIAVIDTEIPLKIEIRHLSRFIIIIVSLICITLIILGTLLGKPFNEMFMTAVALAVSIIPEGLPIVITLVLTTGVWRMSKCFVLVKRLQAIEALGQTNIIAVDKTGTLTKNEIVVQYVYVNNKIFKINGNGYEPKGLIIFKNKIINPLNFPELFFVGKIAKFCSNARLSFLPAKQNSLADKINGNEIGTWEITGDPTEAAMLVFSEKISVSLEEKTSKIFELPFSYQKKYHATIHKIGEKNFLTVVGAPEKILELCQDIWQKDMFGSSISKQMNEQNKKELTIIFHQMAQNGFRVVACAINSNVGNNINIETMPKLTFVSFFGMKDALRPEVKEAVQKVKGANMRVIMITGDHYLTAQAIAKEANIWQEGDFIFKGEEIDAMSDEELIKKLDRTTVFSRVTPDHKLRIIQAFRKQGEIVAMTGDGVNDAPSLVAADLGVAMGKIGTEVAKEASDIVLLNDNFANIVLAVEEGRNIYKTIKKVVLYLFSTNIGEVLTIIFAIILGFPLPILPTQIIWLNFVTDSFLDAGLAMKPKEKELMQNKSLTFSKKNTKGKKWIIDNLMTKRMFLMSLPMTIGTLYLFQNYFKMDLAKALTISLTTLAVFQWFNVWNCRHESKSIFQMNPFSNKFLVGAIVVVIFLQILAIYTPFLQKVLHTQPLVLSEWLIIILIASSIVVIEEIRKWFYRKRIIA